MNNYEQQKSAFINLCALILRQIQQFSSLEDWWLKVVWPNALKSYIPQAIAMIIVLGGTIYVHNWLAALICFVFLLSKSYSVISTTSTNLMQGFLITQIHESYVKGVQDGKEANNQAK